MPVSYTHLDVYKRQALAVALPTALGLVLCFVVATTGRLLGL